MKLFAWKQLLCGQAMIASTPQTKPNYTNHSLYIQLSITAISTQNATQCHFRKIATVSHFRLVLLSMYIDYGLISDLTGTQDMSCQNGGGPKV